MSEINIRGLSKSYDGEQYAIKDIDVKIRDEEIFMLLGPSGCGKTTVLNIIGGFIDPSDGKVLLDGNVVKEPSPERGVIFQETDAAIFPWKTTQENVEFGLKLNGVPKEDHEEIAKKHLEAVGLLEARNKFPRELSGGMKQRIQMARSLALDPDVLLMDEPFASLDAQTKKVLQQELIDTWKEARTTIVFVTHDIEESVIVGSRIGVLSQGPNSHLKDIIDVPLDYPRDITDPKCQEIIERAEKLIGIK
jgi:NitT/TauT family transport system ATP-binding protein